MYMKGKGGQDCVTAVALKSLILGSPAAVAAACKFLGPNTDLLNPNAGSGFTLGSLPVITSLLLILMNAEI